MAQVVLAVFWFLTGIAYVGIGVFNYTKAKSISTIDIPPLEKYFVPPPEEPELNEPPRRTEEAQKRQPSLGSFFYLILKVISRILGISTTCSIA